MKQDIPKAKAAALGMPNGFSFKLNSMAPTRTIQNVPATDVVQKVKEDLAAVGITADLIGEPLTQELTGLPGPRPCCICGGRFPGMDGFPCRSTRQAGMALARQNWAVDLSPEANEIAELTAKAVACSIRRSRSSRRCRHSG